MEKLEMDFVQYWHIALIEEIKEEGLMFDENLSKDLLIIRYFSYLRKKGIRKPYNIKIAKEFNCPPELKKGLDQLIEVLKKGDDISPYLSKQVDKLNNDGMYNDWGILHLHLGDEIEANKKYIKRTGPLLFVYFLNDMAYLINVFQHKDWTKKDILQIMQNNWPELIEPFKIKGAQGLSYEVTDAQHQQLRDAGISVPVELIDKDGTKIVIIPPGMGIMTSGDAMIDVREYQNGIKEVRKLEISVKNNIGLINDTILKQKLQVPNVLRFNLVNIDGKWKVKEVNTGLIFNLSS
ncbi:MAG TPA: hypothetical protein VEB00_15965 [Clostridia bacterium]|nr:hypothetical protein [Clostridia bacterium]